MLNKKKMKLKRYFMKNLDIIHYWNVINNIKNYILVIIVFSLLENVFFIYMSNIIFSELRKAIPFKIYSEFKMVERMD